MLAVNGIAIVLVYLTIKRFEKLEGKSKLNSIREGLNKSSRWMFIIYYVHYFTIRYIILIFVGLTGLVSSLAFWAILLAAQLVFMILNGMKLMEDKVVRFINFLTEVYISLVFAYCLVSQIIDDNDDVKKQRNNFIF